MQDDSYFNQAMAALGDVVMREDLVELCINPDGTVWAEIRGDHFMRKCDVNGGVKTGHAAAQNQASGGAPSAMARALPK